MHITTTLIFLLHSSTVVGFTPCYESQLRLTPNIKTRTAIKKKIKYALHDHKNREDDTSTGTGSQIEGPEHSWNMIDEIDAHDQQEHQKPLTSAATSYASEIKNLSTLLQDAESIFSQIKNLCTTIKQLEISNPNVMKRGEKVSDKLARALAEARAADYTHGSNSLESTRAWDHVKLVSSGVPDVVADVLSNSKTNRYKESAISSHHEYFSVVDPASLDETIEVIAKLEHFAKQVDIECKHVECRGGEQMMP